MPELHPAQPQIAIEHRPVEHRTPTDNLPMKSQLMVHSSWGGKKDEMTSYLTCKKLGMCQNIQPIEMQLHFPKPLQFIKASVL